MIKTHLDSLKAALDARPPAPKKLQILLSAVAEEPAADVQVAAPRQELLAKDDELRAKDDELLAKDDELRAKDDELLAKDDELRTKDDELHAKDALIAELQR